MIHEQHVIQSRKHFMNPNMIHKMVPFRVFILIHGKEALSPLITKFLQSYNLNSQQIVNQNNLFFRALM